MGKSDCNTITFSTWSLIGWGHIVMRKKEALNVFPRSSMLGQAISMGKSVAQFQSCAGLTHLHRRRRRGGAWIQHLDWILTQPHRLAGAYPGVGRKYLLTQKLAPAATYPMLDASLPALIQVGTGLPNSFHSLEIPHQNVKVQKCSAAL